jgi:hypothetical protein
VKYTIRENEMKKGLLMVIVILISSNVFSDTIKIHSGSCYVYNEYYSPVSEYQIQYDTEKNQYYFYTSDFLTKGWIVLSDGNIESLRNSLSKYFSWESTAVTNKVKLEKELPGSVISTNVIWKYGDDWFNAYNITLKLIFFSQSEQRHQLVIYSNKVTSTSNQFIEYKLEGTYLEKSEVLSLYQDLKIENIKITFEKYAEQQKTAEMFK